MRRILGKLLVLLGWGCAGWCGFVGGSFSAIYLVGFIGTGGREAGRELVALSTFTLLGLGVGWALIKVGSRLAKPVSLDV